MFKVIRPFLAGGLALAVIAVVATGHGAPAAAQDARAAAEQYINGVIMGGGDAPGYRPIQPPVVNAEMEKAVAVRSARFAADPPGSKPLATFSVWVYVFPDIDTAHKRVANIKNNGSYNESSGALVNYQWSYSLTGVEEGEAYFWRRRYGDGTSDNGSGIAWRRGLVYIEVSATGGASVPTFNRDNEMLRVGNIQNQRALRAGPYTPPSAATATPVPAATPTTPTSPDTPTSAPAAEPDMNVLVTVRTGGALVRDGTEVRALIGGQECGTATTVLGFTFLGIASTGTRAGCGTMGAAVTFAVDGTPANESTVWTLANIATPLSLTTSGRVGSGGLVVRPTLDVVCIAREGGECSAQDKLLWAGNFDAWFAEFSQRGEQASGEVMLRAWLEFRAQRGEVFGNLAVAFLDKRPYTFILAVRFQQSEDEPVPYVGLFSFGAEREVGGWSVRTGSGASYTFPAGAMLGTGSCRLYTSDPSSAVDVVNACPGAVLTGADPALGAHGYVELLDESGQVVDSVAW